MEDTKFVSFILDENQHSQKSWIEAYNSLKRNPTQASDFLTDREISDTFIASFEIYGTRIAEFLRKVPQYIPKTTPGKQAKEELDSKKAVGGYLVKEVVLPLLGNGYQQLHNRDALFELLVSVIPLSDRSLFDQLAARLGEIPRLLGKLISEERSCDFMHERANFLASNPKSMQTWAETVVDLVRNCDNCHDVFSTIDRWGFLKTLRVYLKTKHESEAPKQSLGSSSATHPQANFRIFKAGEERSGQKRQASVASLATKSFAPEIITLLKSCGMSVPTSESTLLHTINEIETTETLNVIQTVISTFPCRLCFRRGYGRTSDVILPTINTDSEQRLKELDLGSFEELFGNSLGIWKISLSAQALKDLKNSKKEGNFRYIKEKLEKLASGEWSGKSIARPVADPEDRFKVRLFQAWYGSNGRILWQVDIGFDEKNDADCQIVRVWRIGDVKEILSSLASVSFAQQSFSQSRITSCKINSIEKHNNRKIPVLFGRSGQDSINDSDPKTTDKRTAQDMLISGKFHTLTSTVLESIVHDQPRSDFPLDVTGQEVDIIKHFRTATFILGRSGTGKTSCLLYKLLGRYLARNLVERETPIRQLLLTRSKPLARKLESEVQLLIDTQLLRVGAGFNPGDDEIDIPTHFRDGIDEETTEDLLSLKKQDFPLVCTFGHFLKRLENTINFFSQTTTGKGETPATTMHQMVDFDIFKVAYWQKFPAILKVGLEPELVFAEIMGVIKGAASLLTNLQSLSREEYRSKSSRLAPTFTREGDRDKVYDVFEHYESKKNQYGDYDGIDRVKVVLRELAMARNIRLRRRLEALFEEVYVDEVQDQRPLEIELLLSLVQNPRGIHFAGDSAQCISKDSTFRFANIKALFYDHFQGSAFASIDPRLAKPELFSLSRNFRSHQGILSLASFVMELLWRGFPDMVDKLLPEIGQYMGPKPVIFVGSELIELMEMAGKSHSERDRKESQCESNNSKSQQVSNKQVVIVRDQLVQEELQERLGNGALVFTILQSKGMEYDNVFLFDFFSSSPCLKSFKSLQDLLYGGPNPLYSTDHMTMCSELKNLYVAITRPRNRLWVLESKTSFILELFTTKAPSPLVDIKHFKSADLPGLMPELRPASATSAQEWIETGEQCMERGVLDQALRCFKNAQSTKHILWAEASIAEQKGRESRAQGNTARLISSFKQAGDLFLEIGMNERAAHCLEASGDFATAAELYSEKRRHEKAAGLFERAKMHEKAAHQYHKAGMAYKALQALYNGKLFEELVRSVHKYRDSIEDRDRKIYARQCNIHLRQGKITPLLREQTLNTFFSDEEKEEFLKEFQHKKELLDFYLVRGKLKEAFRYIVKLGEFEEALELIMDQGSKYSIDLNESEDDLQLKEIFKYAQTRKLFSSISKSSATSVDLSFSQSLLGNSWSHPWADLVAVANGYFKDGIKPNRNDIKEPWIREYMDIIISMNIEYFLKSGEDLDSLPLEYLCGLSEISRGISENKGLPIPQSVLLCLGVLLVPGEGNTYVVLTWSNLVLDRKSSRSLSYEEISKKIITYVSKQMLSSRSLLEMKARKLWIATSKVSKCDTCVIQGLSFVLIPTSQSTKQSTGKWDGPGKEAGPGLKCSHDFPSGTQPSKSMESLIRLCRSLEALGEPTLDYWLDTLYSQLIYVSSFFQDAGVIAITGDAIRTSTINTSVTNKLQNRFCSCWKPWELKNTKHDFTSLLEKYQLGCNLGVTQGNLNLILSKRVKPHTKSQPLQKDQNQPPQPDFVEKAFRSYQSLRALSTVNPSQFSTGRFCESVCRLLMSLLSLQSYTKCLSFYHGSVISIYEDIVTFLLFSSRRTDVVIPRSWAKLYLPHWEPCLKATTDLEQCCYQQTLLRVIANFCDLISNLESFPQGKPSETELLVRRSVDLLVVAIVNIGTIGPLPLRYDEIWGKIQRVFGHKSLKTDRIQGLSPNALIQHLSRAFQFYNGKDSILVYTREGKVSKRVESWEGTGIQLVLLPIRQNFVLDLQVYGKEQNAPYIIQAWYRIQRAKYTRRQTHMTTTFGRAVSFLQILCDTQKSKKSSRKVFREFTAIMFTLGLELYLLIDTITARSRVVRELAEKMHITEKYTAKFMNFEELISKVRSLFGAEGPNTLDLKTSEFQIECEKGLETMKSLDEQMNMIMRMLQEPSEGTRTGNNRQKKGQVANQKEWPDSKFRPNDGKKSRSANLPNSKPTNKQKDKSNDGLESGQKSGTEDKLKKMPNDGPKNGKNGKNGKNESDDTQRGELKELADMPKDELEVGPEDKMKIKDVGAKAQTGKIGRSEEKPETPVSQLSERRKEKSREPDAGAGMNVRTEPNEDDCIKLVAGQGECAQEQVGKMEDSSGKVEKIKMPVKLK